MYMHHSIISNKLKMLLLTEMLSVVPLGCTDIPSPAEGFTTLPHAWFSLLSL